MYLFDWMQVVQNAVRQLQHCVTERSALEAVDLYHQEQRKSGAGGFTKTASKRLAAELAYQRRAETNLNDENCFKVYIVSFIITTDICLSPLIRLISK